MAKQRMINTRFWIDDYVSNLDPVEKLLFLYFLTNPYTDICGIYEVPLKHVAFETGLDKDMVIKIIERFSKDGKIFYENGWVAIKNFAKHQLNNPKVKIGIENGLKQAPPSLIDRLSIDYHALSHLNLNSNLNPNSNLKIATKSQVEPPKKEEKEEKPFNWEDYWQAMDNHKSRHVQVIAFYFKKKGIKFDSQPKAASAIRRHLRAAKELANFDDEEIVKAYKVADKEYRDKYTIETLYKILTR
jgi:hypothetical protein